MYTQIERLTDQAQCLTRAAVELLQTDQAFSPADMVSKDTEKQAAVFDLLRMHGTATGLLFMLLDTLDTLAEAARTAADAETRPRGREVMTNAERENVISEIIENLRTVRILSGGAQE